jgi:basic membrane lipoprotein Med (substrate-binding protein (PBP1-ABC) superfamily)
MKHLINLLGLAALLLLCGCPPPAKKGASGNSNAGQTTAAPAASQKIHVALLASDLGLGDGWNVRQLNTLLAGRAAGGSIQYSLIGTLPAEISYGEITARVGFPDPLSSVPGSMTELQADALLAGAPPSDWLILSSGYVLQHALDRIAAGTLQAGAIIVVEEAGSQAVVNTTKVPVYRLRFDIRPAAFLAGAAAARSNNRSHFVLLGADDDPQVDEFIAAATAGMKYVSRGVWILDGVLPVDSRGMIPESEFAERHKDMMKQAGKDFVNNHYIIDLTRSSSYILRLIAEDGGPIDGYATSGYQDLRVIASSRVLTCAIKKPDVAVAWLLDNCAAPGELAGHAVKGYLEFGLKGSRPGLNESALGFTDMDSYSRFNYDGAEIAEDVVKWWKEIEAGELAGSY